MPPGMEPMSMLDQMAVDVAGAEVQQAGDAGENDGMSNVGSDHDLEGRNRTIGAAS